MNMRRSEGIVLSKMTFYKDFLNTGGRGDLYPVAYEEGTASPESICEEVDCGRFYVRCQPTARRLRVIGGYFPYATCEVTVREHTAGELGFAFLLPDRTVSVSLDATAHELILRDGDETWRVTTDECLGCGDGLLVSSRYCAIDVFVRKNGYCRLLHSFKPEGYIHAFDRDVAAASHVALLEAGSFVIDGATVSVDNGLSIADIRPVKNECGEVLTEQGRVYLTASVREVEQAYQGVYSWLPGTADLRLEGALFFDVGDGMIAGDVASTLVYDRREGVWHLWYCSFSHGHTLAYVRAEGDVRFGVNILDARLMPTMSEGDPDTVFLSKQGDEDPDLTYDPVSKKWYLTVCRLVNIDGKNVYRYFLFSSDRPDGGFTYISNSQSGDETGGNILRHEGRLYFLCGSGFDRRAEYHIYDLPGFSGVTNAKFDYDDGGFRGWGTLIPVRMGTRTRYFWLTFDRHLSSGYNWSYGNLYCFEGTEPTERIKTPPMTSAH